MGGKTVFQCFCKWTQRLIIFLRRCKNCVSESFTIFCKRIWNFSEKQTKFCKQKQSFQGTQKFCKQMQKHWNFLWACNIFVRVRKGLVSECKVSWVMQNVVERMQKFCAQTQEFLWECGTFAREQKDFVSKCKVYQGMQYFCERTQRFCEWMQI